MNPLEFHRHNLTTEFFGTHFKRYFLNKKGDLKVVAPMVKTENIRFSIDEGQPFRT